MFYNFLIIEQMGYFVNWTRKLDVEKAPLEGSSAVRR